MQKKIYCCLITAWMLFSLQPAGFAGWVETGKDGKTIINIKVDGLPDSTFNDPYSRAEVAAVKEFIRLFPQRFAQKYRNKYSNDPARYGRFNWDNVEIRLHPFSGIKVQGIENDLLAIAGKIAPDVLYINFRKSDNYIRNGFLYPLDEFIEALPASEKKHFFEERIHEKVWDVIKRKGPDGAIHTWALPYGGTPLGKVLIFRKDLFDRNNVPYPDINWTWHDLYEACKKIADPGQGIYGIEFGRGKAESWHWITFLWSAGGEVMQYDEKPDTWRCTFDSDAGVMALDFYTRLSAERWIDHNGIIRRGYAYKDARDAAAKWVRGEIAMRIEYINERSLASFNPEINGIAPVPKGPTGMRGAELNSRMYGMFSEIKNPVIRDAAWEYMYYWDSEAAAKVRTELMVEGGLGQFVMPKYLLKFGYSDIVRLSPKGWDEFFDIAIRTGKPEPYGKNSNFAYDQMSVPLQIVELMELNDRLPPPDQSEARNAILRAELKAANDRANELMIGDISPAEQLKRRVMAIIFLSAVVIAYFFVFRKIFRIFTPDNCGDNNQVRWGFRKYPWAYILLLPAVLTILTWNYLPLARGSIMAFFDYKILGRSIFVGVDNFGNLLADNIWWQSVWNAFRYSILVIAMTFLPPMILAILLQEIPKGKLFFRMIYYLPAVVSGLVTMLLWKQFYEPSEFGILNRIVMQIPAIGFIGIGLLMLMICLAFAKRLWLYQMWLPMTMFVVAGIILLLSFSALARPILFPGGESWGQSLAAFFPRLLQHHREPYRWLFNPNTAMISCVIPMVWAGMGPGCLIYLAALKGIPEDYYEAADLDGATFIDKILFVVFPSLKALVIINFVGAFINSWYASTGNILVMTGGDAATRTETAGLYIWYKAFTFLGFGPATAAAWMLAFILIGFTVHQLQILSKVEFRSGDTKK